MAVVFSPSLHSRLLVLVAGLFVFGAGLAGCGDDNDSMSGDEIVSITSPSDDGYVDDRRVRIEGTVQGQHDVEVNGNHAEVQDGRFEAVVQYDHDGRVRATAEAGGDKDSVDFTIDTVIPEFEIHSPERGSVIDAAENEEATVTVEGEIGEVGQSGLRIFEVNGQSIDVEAGQSFETEISLVEGFNLLSFHAIDGAHNQIESNRAVVYGPLSSPDSSIDNAARLDIDNPSGIQAITDVLEAYITPERILGYVVAGFQDSEDIPVDVTDIDWESLDIELTPTDGILEIEIQITDLDIVGEFPVSDGEDPVEGSVHIGEITVQLDLELGADADNQLDIDVVNKDDPDQIETEDVTVIVEDKEREWLEGPTEVAIAVAFGQFVEELVADNLYDPDVMTQEVEFLNRTIVFSLLLEDVIVSSTGISIEMGLEFPEDRHENVAPLPGALDRPVDSNPTGSVDRPVLFHTTRTAADRLLHGIWETGLLHQEIGSDELADFQLPFELTADGLGGLLDSRIRDIHETDTPAKLSFRPLLPPIVEFRNEDSATARIGDFLVDILLLPEQGPATLVLTLALHLDIDIEVVIEDDEAGLDIDIEAQGDVADEPQFSFDRADTVDLITELLEVIPNFLDSELEVDAEAELEWATISNPTVKTHGVPRDRATIGVDVEPAEDYIEDDDIDDPEDD